VGDYRADYPLTIDPELVFSTYLGGKGRDTGESIARRAAARGRTGRRHPGRFDGSNSSPRSLTPQPPRSLMLTIEDDGVGLSESRTAGIGLSAMHERADELGGAFQIAARPEGGTRAEATFPLNDAGATHD
jgi:two-component sensor histidine kinase